MTPDQIPKCLKENDKFYKFFNSLWINLTVKRKSELKKFYDIYLRAYDTYLVWKSKTQISSLFHIITKTEILEPFIEEIKITMLENSDITFQEATMFDLLLGVSVHENWYKDKNYPRIDTIIPSTKFDTNCDYVFDHGLLTVYICPNDSSIIELIKQKSSLKEKMYSIMSNINENLIKNVIDDYNNLLKPLLEKQKVLNENIEKSFKIFYNQMKFILETNKLASVRQKELCDYINFYTKVLLIYDEWKNNEPRPSTITESNIDINIKTDIIEKLYDCEKNGSITILTQDEYNILDPMFHGCRHWDNYYGFPTIKTLINEIEQQQNYNDIKIHQNTMTLFEDNSSDFESNDNIDNFIDLLLRPSPVSIMNSIDVSPSLSIISSSEDSPSLSIISSSDDDEVKSSMEMENKSPTINYWRSINLSTNENSLMSSHELKQDVNDEGAESDSTDMYPNQLTIISSSDSEYDSDDIIVGRNLLYHGY